MFRHSVHRTLDMTEGPLSGKVLIYALPIMLSGFLQLLFNAADSIVVGRFAGSEALAAVGSVGSLNNMIISLFIGLSVGVSVLVARYTGSQDSERVSQTVHTAVILAVIGGTLLAFVGFAAAHPLLELMGSPEDVIDLAELYVRIIFLGMPVQMLYNFCAAVLSSVGDTKRPLYFLTIAGVVNIVLNLIFVIALHLSVAGVALATIISQAISAALAVRSLMTAQGPTRLFRHRLRIHRSILLQILLVGLPAGIQSSVFSFSNVIIQSSINSFGSIVIAGNAAAMNVGNFVDQAMSTFQQTITCFAGQNIGARKPSRVITSMKVCLFWAVFLGLALSALCCIFGRQLLGLYSADERVVEAGLQRLYIVCGPYFICGLMDVMIGVLRGVGYSLLPMIVSLLGACAFRVLWVMTIFCAMPSMGCLLLSYPVSWALTFGVMAVIFARLWQKLRRGFTAEELARN